MGTARALHPLAGWRLSVEGFDALQSSSSRRRSFSPARHQEDQTRNNRFRISGTNFCLNVPNAVAVNGQRLQLFNCGTPAFDNELFDVTSRGEIKTLPSPSALCMSGQNDNVSNFNPVVSANCGGSTAARRQQFYVRGPIKWAGDNNKCMDVANAVSFNGAPVQLHTCVAGAQNELWDYYF